MIRILYLPTQISTWNFGAQWHKLYVFQPRTRKRNEFRLEI
jgi:hypothetical protein